MAACRRKRPPARRCRRRWAATGITKCSTASPTSHLEPLHHARPAGGDVPEPYNNGIQIFQSPGYVVINLEMIHEARLVPLGKMRRSTAR